MVIELKLTDYDLEINLNLLWDRFDVFIWMIIELKLIAVIALDWTESGKQQLLRLINRRWRRRRRQRCQTVKISKFRYWKEKKICKIAKLENGSEDRSENFYSWKLANSK